MREDREAYLKVDQIYANLSALYASRPMINTEKLCRKFQKEHQVLIMSLTEHNKIYLTLERRYKQLSQWPVESRRSSRKKSGKRSRRKKLQVREFTSDLEHFYQQYHHIIIQIDGLLSAKVANDLAGHMFDQSLLRQVQPTCSAWMIRR